ncbi:LacI family DNA-binding transcriptional regulator [Telmatospirillum sp. J64-1]|uniref:LacI family DNA-binding transcriptional regulator n=1 Tax=Telmatospirillum sp. J64-1 TaxID=2502183 RepID=UPI001C8F65CA|nr:LacI family DNA-binding transcriptional regulator [Telmatospirillum sp. J64-1]
MGKAPADDSRGAPPVGGKRAVGGRGNGQTIGLRQVAAIAGVSTATVSRVINNPDVVSPELRTRIEMVIKQLGWVPSGAARALATKRTGAIGAVFPALAQGDFARAIDALQDELTQRNHTLLLARSRYSEELEHQQVVKLVERGVDGLVLVGKTRPYLLQTFLDQQKVPYVNTFVFEAGSSVPCIGPDNHQALFRMTEYLISLGHRKFALIAQSTKNNDRAQARREGVFSALAEHGLAITPAHSTEGQWSIEEGRQLFRRILDAKPWPTAVICGNSMLAIGAVLESQAMGIKVPEEMSIVGYDDIEIMRELPISITTVRVASDEIGRIAGKVIVEMVSGGASVGGVELPSELVVRQSSGPAPRR